MIDWPEKEHYTAEDLVEIIRILRRPDGCPWDRVQTHRSIRKNFLEETCEALEAIAMTIHRRIYGYYRNQVAAQRVRQIELLNSLRVSYGLAPC